MDEGLSRRSSDHRFQDVPDNSVKSLLNERVAHGLDKVNSERQKEAVFLDQNERMSTATIASNYPLISFDNWYFLSVKEEEQYSRN